MALHIQQYPSMSTEASAKPVLVLIHGGALSHRMYKDMISLLHEHDIVAPDLPGHGESVACGPFTFTTSTKLLAEALQQLQNQVERLRARHWVVVGISLGGQATLDLIRHHPTLVDAAVVSGVSIHPPNDAAQFELPHMPTSPDWITIMTEDVQKMGLEAAQAVQAESFTFQFEPSGSIPPTLVLVGEHDIPMAKRDYDTLVSRIKQANKMSEGEVLPGAWHNHSIDVPQVFAERVIARAQKVVK